MRDSRVDRRGAMRLAMTLFQAGASLREGQRPTKQSTAAGRPESAEGTTPEKRKPQAVNRLG